MKKTREELKTKLWEIDDCVQAWNNDEEKMIVENEKTPEDILADFLVEEENLVIQLFQDYADKNEDENVRVAVKIIREKLKK